MRQVKLVIWDLDETFWKGTLSEGPITYVQKNHDIVVELTRRGIINSISSKNTFEDARRELEQHGIWDYFVFPKIEWQPKGQLIAGLIEEMQLRPENVLFIDDNHLNLEEARYFNPELQTAGPEILDGLLQFDACRGKDDRELSRLKQYKLLEKKALDQKNTAVSNEDFLRSCAIEIEVSHNCDTHAERILELINRTNQLNYTKQRLTREELTALFADPQLDKGYVRVRDRYGDYGICGFYALEQARLQHFVFSCRILNMGIEHWLYRRLGSPELDIAGEVVTPLTKQPVPDWVHEARKTVTGRTMSARDQHGTLNILLKGGCDLTGIKNYLSRGAVLSAEVDYVSEGGYRINNSHTEILKRCNTATLQQYGHIIDKIHFFDRSAFTTDFFSNAHDVYLYSVLDDYTRGLYRYRDSDFIIPFGDFNADLTDESTWTYHTGRSAKHRLDREFLGWFRDNFTFLGPIDPDTFKKNIAWICDSLSPGKLLIILNGSEVAYRRNPQNGRWQHHRLMNRGLAQTVSDKPSVVICNVAELITAEADHSHNIRHYSRKGYYCIAQRLNEIIEQRCRVSRGFWERQLDFIRCALGMQTFLFWDNEFLSMCCSTGLFETIL